MNMKIQKEVDLLLGGDQEESPSHSLFVAQEDDVVWRGEEEINRFSLSMSNKR